jgi:ubiquinone/menaquinone biosynthesis C-methylase UbiE
VGHRLGKAAVAGSIPARGSTLRKPQLEVTTMPTTPEEYLKNINLEAFFKTLAVSNPKTLVDTAKHFTTKEAQRRDRIVLNYFGQAGIDRIVDTVTEKLLEKPELSSNTKLLDMGAGTGFFTIQIATKLRATKPEASFYAMDLTPAMLLSLAKKNADIKPFVGVAENIKASIAQARQYLDIPSSFDAIFSTLMLHHSEKPEKVFESLKRVLKKNGKAIVVDLCEHSFEEFRAEMGDLHLGFRPQSIREMAQKHFSHVEVEKLLGICCECSGRAAEIFVASMYN